MDSTELLGWAIENFHPRLALSCSFGDAEGMVHAELVSAYPASDAQQAQIIEGLRRRLGREIELTCSTDSELLGGAIIRAGDLVIDGSVRGKLERLGTALSH